MQLRPYQQKAIKMLWEYMRQSPGKNPVLVLPTGSGKSHVISAVCQEAIKGYRHTRILMLTHVKEIIEQNAKKLKEAWPEAPLGIYSASVGEKCIKQITFAGIQSLVRSPEKIGFIDVVIIDECHLVSHKNIGRYRDLLTYLKDNNPNLIVIGLTATPWRLTHGLITKGDTIWDDIIEPVTIIELIKDGYLSILRSKFTDHQIDTSKVRKHGGEFINKDLQAAVDIDKHNLRIAKEIVERAGDRKKWLLFCTGVKHAKNMRDALRSQGVTAEYIHGGMSRSQRERILNDHYEGRFTALCNCQILTTGYDSPNIDLLAMIRPTMSLSLYVQMIGRGMRVKDHTDHCLVLDFAGNIEIHGPITNLNIPDYRKKKKPGEAPIKVCPKCSEILHLSCMVCDACKYEFPKTNKLSKLKFHNADIMDIDIVDMPIKSWLWNTFTSKKGNDMIRVRYVSSDLNFEPIFEYFAIYNEGKAGQIARAKLNKIIMSCKVNLGGSKNIEETCRLLTLAEAPYSIKFYKDGKYKKIVGRNWLPF